MLTLALCVCLFLGYFLYKRVNSRFGHLASPGPCLPILGHVYKLFKKEVIDDPVNGMWNLWRNNNKNGILYLKAFGIDQIFVGDFETVKQIFSTNEAAGRQKRDVIKMITKIRKVSGPEVPGVLLSDGNMWHQTRRFTLRALRDFGFGKQGMEELIQEEIIQFKTMLDGIRDEPVDFAFKLNLPVLNALWRVTVGERFDYDDAKLQDIVRRLTDTFKIFGDPAQGLILAFPWIEPLIMILPDFLKWKYAKKLLMDIVDLMEENIIKHKETLDVNAPRDFIDMMLIEREKTTDPSSPFYGQTGLDNLKVTLFDLFLAGSETTSTTLNWAVLYMVRYPEVQARVQEELDTVVGTDRMPTISDKQDLPFTEATIMEIQRHSNIVPAGAPHWMLKDLEVNGQLIPANCLVFPLFTEILKGDHWGDGEVFRPQRFLDEAGKVKKDEHFIPFSVGKRQCLGETLAKTELFLFFTALVQQYRFQPEKEGLMPTEESVTGVTSLPKPYKVTLTNRLA